MADNTYSSILSDLKKKVYKPIYLLCGNQSFFIDKIADYIENNVLDESEKAFNQTILYGKDLENNLGQLIEICKSFPMSGDRQVVIVKEAQVIKKLDELDSYIKNPTSSTILVLCYKYGSPDKRKSYLKEIAKNGVLYETPVMYDNQVPTWIMDYCEGLKVKIQPDAAAMLFEFLGMDLQNIANAIEKIMINFTSGGVITADLVAKNIGINKNFTVFEYQKALSNRDFFKANQIINYFAANPKGDNHPIMIIGMLFNYFSKTMLYHSLSDKSKASAAKVLKINPFFVSDYEHAARAFPVQKLFNIIKYLREYDLKMKGVESNADPGELLKELNLKILAG